ncbi:MAG: mechanosensitive ion channel [Cyclobacteriaceae bacterium]
MLPEFFQTFIDKVNSLLPGVLGAVVVLLVGWIFSAIVRRIIHGLLKKTEWDEKLLGNTIVDTNKFLANLVYYLMMFFVLLLVLEMMGVTYVLDPLQRMFDGFVAFIPNLLYAIAISMVGYVVAKFVSNLVKIAGSLIDRLAKGIGFQDTDKLIYFIQQLVFIILLIPFVIQALNILQLEAVTQPINNVLRDIMDAVPRIVGAGILITFFVIGGKFLTTFLKDLLTNIGTDSLTEKLQLTLIGDFSLSTILSGMVFYFMVFFGVISGVEMLSLDRLAEVLHTILNLSGNILFGLLVVVIGNTIAELVYKAMDKKNNEYVAGLMRIGIIGLFLAIALRTMGIANSIVELAFGLTLGSLAVTIALAYGLGGREAAGKHMEKILKRFQKEKD